MPVSSQPSYTVIIASNAGDRPYRFEVPVSWLKALAFLGFCSLLFFADIAIDYVGLLPRAREHETLSVENASLSNSKLVLEKRLYSMSADLDRVQTLTQKLRRISKLADENQIITPVDESAARSPA